jgi:hypothetical protein
MSLVKSMVNQIGREIGKDVYKGIKSNITSTIASSIDNYRFQNELSEFKLSAYDKVTIKNLINLIEKSEDINPRGFNDWELCYIDLDEKIDFCKQHLDNSHLPKLEELDKLNHLNYSIAKSRHKTFVEKQIENIDNEIKSYEKSNIIVPISLSLIGLNSIYYKTGWWVWHFIWLFVSGFLTYKGLTLPKSDSFEPFYLVIIGGVIYGLILLASLFKIRREHNRIKNLKEHLIKLKEYYTSNFK